MNVVQIVIDSLRTDHLGCYAGAKAQTPNIDRLAAQSCVFEFAISESLPTVPVRRALSTCKRTFPYQDPPRPKGLTNSRYGWRPLPEAHVTVAEMLAPTDYTTGVVADTYHLMKPAMNFHRFFDSWQWIRGQEFDLYRSGRLDADLRRYTNLDDLNSPRLRTLKQFLRNQQGRDAEDEFQEAQLFAAAAQWIEDNRDETFFLWVDSFSPHPPWRVPQRFIDLYDPGYEGLEPIYEGCIDFARLSERELHHFRAIYAANVTWVDCCVGRLLDKLEACGLMDDTLIVLLSDHGRMLGEYDLKVGMASQFVYPELYKIVAMIRHPHGVGAGRRVRTPVHNIDLIAAMLEFMGVDPPEPVDGISVRPLMTGEQTSIREYLISAQQDYHSVWEPGWLYYRGPEGEHLYAIDEDPAERNDLAQANEAKTRQMRERLDDYLERTGGVQVCAE